MDQRRNHAGAEQVGAAARLSGRPGVSRRLLAAGVLLLWIAGLALLARRELLKPASERLAEAALQLQPAVNYFVLERDGVVVGAAAAEVDTARNLVALRQHAMGRLVPGDTTAVTVNARSAYTRRLAFESLRIDVLVGSSAWRINADRSADSLLLVTMGPPAGPAEIQRPRPVAPDPLFLPVTAAVPLALLNRPRPGRETTIGVFDPWTGTVRRDALRVESESLFVVVDSAAFDPARRRWIMAHRDTVRAWLVTSDSGTFRAWVDRAGRIVEANDGRGLRAVRTAYEIAYENWRLTRDQ